MAQKDLRKVRQCASKMEEARAEFHMAIFQAKVSGEVLRDIAEAAGISFQRVSQIVREERRRLTSLD